MRKTIALSAVAGLILSGALAAQCPVSSGSKAEKACPVTGSKAKLAKQEKTQECDKASCDKQEKVALSEKVANLQKAAAKGCKTAKAKLAGLKKDCGTQCSKSLSQKIAHLEKAAGKGCEKSRAKLAALEKRLAPEPAPLSERLAGLAAAAKKGCCESKAKLAAVKEICGTQCPQEMAKKVAMWETYAGKGCKTSKAKLAAIESSLAPADAKAGKAGKSECGSSCGSDAKPASKKAECGSSCGSDAKPASKKKEACTGGSCSGKSDSN